MRFFLLVNCLVYHNFLYRNKALCICQLPLICVVCLILNNVKPLYVPANISIVEVIFLVFVLGTGDISISDRLVPPIEGQFIPVLVNIYLFSTL